MTLFTRTALPAVAVAFTLSLASAAMAGEIFTSDGIAIRGYDPVSYFTDHKPVKGSAKFTSTYKGATFQFVSAAHRDTFAGNPEHYAPQYGGFCAFGTAQGHKATTQPQAFTVINDKLYLNYNDDVAKTWRADVGGYVKKANENWDAVKAEAQPQD